MSARPAWASPLWSDEQVAIVARRRARHDVLNLCATWRPQGMAIATFWYLATGHRWAGRRSMRLRRIHRDRRSVTRYPTFDRRYWEERRMP